MTRTEAHTIAFHHDAIVTRTTENGLIVPAWVMKDRDFYKRVRRRGFRTQRALDSFINREAGRRHRPARKFFPRAEREITHGCVVAVRRRPRVLEEYA